MNICTSATGDQRSSNVTARYVVTPLDGLRAYCCHAALALSMKMVLILPGPPGLLREEVAAALAAYRHGFGLSSA